MSSACASPQQEPAIIGAHGGRTKQRSVSNASRSAKLRIACLVTSAASQGGPAAGVSRLLQGTQKLPGTASSC